MPNLRDDVGNPLKTYQVSDGSEELAVYVANSIDTGYQIGATQRLTLSATAQSTTAFSNFGAATHVRIIGDRSFYLAQGVSPTATSGDCYFPADTQGIVIQVPDGYKLSVLQAAGGGNFYATQVTFPINYPLGG